MSLADVLKKALLSAQNQVKPTVFKVSSAVAPSIAIGNQVQAPRPRLGTSDLQKMANSLAGMLTEFLRDPRPERATKIRSVLQSIRKAYGEEVYRAVVSALRNSLKNTPYLEVFDILAGAGDVALAINLVNKIRALRMVEEIYRKYGKPLGLSMNEVAQLVDRNGRINVKQLAKHVRDRLLKAYGLAKRGQDHRALREVIRDIRRIVRFGEVFMGKGIRRRLVSELKRILPVQKNKEELVRFFSKTVQMRPEEAVATLLSEVGRKAPTARQVQETVERLRKAEAEKKATLEGAAKVEAQRLSKITAAIKKG